MSTGSEKMADMSNIQRAGNDISKILESYGFHELEALMALEFVRISIQASIIKKSASLEVVARP